MKDKSYMKYSYHGDWLDELKGFGLYFLIMIGGAAVLGALYWLFDHTPLGHMGY